MSLTFLFLLNAVMQAGWKSPMLVRPSARCSVATPVTPLTARPWHVLRGALVLLWQLTEVISTGDRLAAVWLQHRQVLIPRYVVP